MTPQPLNLTRLIWGALIGIALLVGLCAPNDARAKERIAILELANPAGLTKQETTYLSELLRGLVSDTLGDQYITIDKATMFTLLPQGMTPECLDEAKCEIEMGQMMQATYIITGSVIRFGKNLRVSIRLYDTRTGQRVGSEVASGAKIDDMETGIQEAGGRLLRRLSPSAGGSGEGQSERRVIGGGATQAVSGFQRRLIVTLRSDPEGAGVTIDGVQKCSEGSQTCQVELTEGAHQVRMSKTDYFERSGSVTFSSDQRSLDWRLDPNFATLEVSVTPSNLRYSINGDERSGDHSRRITPEKRYRVVSADRCYDSGGEEVKAGRPGDALKVRLAPSKRYATLDLSARNPSGGPLEASVYVDGDRVGATPGQFKVWVCASTLRLSHSVHGEEVSSLSLSDGEVARRVVTLNDSAGARARRVRTWGWVSVAVALASAGVSAYGYTQVQDSKDQFASTRDNRAKYDEMKSQFDQAKPLAYAGLGSTLVFSAVSAILFAQSSSISSDARLSVAPTSGGALGAFEWRW